MARDYASFETDLRIRVEDRILRLTLHNPDRLNANTPAMHAALSRIWDEIADDPGVDLVIVTGAGERAFSAGGDPEHMLTMIANKAEWWQTVREARRLVRRMLACEKPILARINGHAVGFGATLALCADILVAVEDARIGDPHVSAGLVAGDGGALLWPLLVGYPRAKELLLTGELISGTEALAMGLVNYAVPREQLDAKVDEIARKILAAPAQAVRLTKHALNAPLRAAAEAAMDLGMANESLTTFSDDHLEAATAMRDKRPPRFTNE